jgi:hypothetical protein
MVIAKLMLPIIILPVINQMDGFVSIIDRGSLVPYSIRKESCCMGSFNGCGKARMLPHICSINL